MACVILRHSSIGTPYFANGSNGGREDFGEDFLSFVAMTHLFEVVDQLARDVRRKPARVGVIPSIFSTVDHSGDNPTGRLNRPCPSLPVDLRAAAVV
jgi:hypothetical protein